MTYEENDNLVTRDGFFLLISSSSVDFPAKGSAIMAIFDLLPISKSAIAIWIFRLSSVNPIIGVGSNPMKRILTFQVNKALLKIIYIRRVCRKSPDLSMNYYAVFYYQYI